MNDSMIHATLTPEIKNRTLFIVTAVKQKYFMVVLSDYWSAMDGNVWNGNPWDLQYRRPPVPAGHTRGRA